ncbi:hypothetical protein F444_20323 [Phytophthora nicotianae P1976]|uniref:Uncharacterized protein n=1 Tax=Phytophthora nicotianae P1976 TaxID=1317066 RepID=A0A080Z4Y4_PHYNI|nr:hypothetical protein F444_20323 [Phytophthora nicotianae P1976]
MDVLLNVEQQLVRVADALMLPSNYSHASRVPSAAILTPVLIHIEQLLDEIRSKTRAIVAQASRQRTEELTNTKNAEFEDLRIKLETQDLVDYDSETETEDEAAVEKEKEGENELMTGVGVKRSRDDETEKAEEPKLKRQELAVVRNRNRLRDNVAIFVKQAKKCSELREDEEAATVRKAMTTLMHRSSLSLKGMVGLIQDGGNISEAIAADFRDAVVLLPTVIERHQEKRKISRNWIEGTTKSIAQVVAHAKKNADVPACLADPQLEAMPRSITEIWASSGPDLLRKMENYIEQLTRFGALEPDRMEKPLGKLASIFRKDIQTCKQKNSASRTEEDWSRFARIAEVLVEWICLAERATEPPNLRPHLLRFDRQIKGFAKKNPGRIPPNLIEYVKLALLTRLSLTIFFFTNNVELQLFWLSLSPRKIQKMKKLTTTQASDIMHDLITARTFENR